MADAAINAEKPETPVIPQSIAQENILDYAARPQNWSSSRKWTATFILSGFAFIQPLSETMLAPLEEPLMHSLKITKGYRWIMVNSIILIGVGLGPLILAPASEIFGRKRAILAGSLTFIIWNTCCGFATTFNQMIAFRTLAGFGACTADAVAGGVIADIWDPAQRGTAFAFFMAAPLLGPGFGPIFGAYISTDISWRWAFWITSIASVAIFLVAVLFLKETYEPRLIYLQCKKIKSTQSNAERNNAALAPKGALMSEALTTNFQRPVRMLATQPVIQLIALYMALLYGTMFLFLFMYATLWTRQYRQSIRVSSLNYISAAIGYIAGVQGKHFSDPSYFHHLLKPSSQSRDISMTEYTPSSKHAPQTKKVGPNFAFPSCVSELYSCPSVSCGGAGPVSVIFIGSCRTLDA